MRILGIDFGTKKVGLALTDEAGTMAFPHQVIPNDDQLLDAIVVLITEQQVGEVVLGQSLDLDGTPNPVQEQIEQFITDLTLRLPVPIALEPEQFTSKQAAAVTGRNEQTDAAAAALILESYLAKQKNTTPPEPTYIEFEQFTAVDIRIGTITAVSVVPDADKLLNLTVDVGEVTPRQILSGIREYFQDEQTLVGRQCPFVLNLPPRKIRGFESQGMILAAGEAAFALLEPSQLVEPGTRVS